MRTALCFALRRSGNAVYYCQSMHQIDLIFLRRSVLRTNRRKCYGFAFVARLDKYLYGNLQGTCLRISSFEAKIFRVQICRWHIHHMASWTQGQEETRLGHSVYRKPTHSDRYLNVDISVESSSCSKTWAMTTGRTIPFRNGSQRKWIQEKEYRTSH